MRHESGDKLTKCTHSYYSLINDRSQGCQYLWEDSISGKHGTITEISYFKVDQIHIGGQ